MRHSILLLILLAVIGCQPLHVNSSADKGIQPTAKTLIKGEETWVELKTMIPGEGKEWIINFQGNVVPKFVSHIESPYQVIAWKVRNKNEQPIITKYTITLVNEDMSRKVEVDLSTQTSNAIKETLRVFVHLIH